MRIAIIGTGISGMVSAWLLHREHEITVFESEARIGGHTNTLTVTRGGREWAVDTGFIVCNDWTYPNFLKLMEVIGVPLQPTTMSFSVHDEASGLEYGGSSLNALFCQRRNLLRFSFLRMVREILRFNREAVELINAADSSRLAEIPLGEYLASRGYHREFIDHYLIPMGGAIWSSAHHQMLRFPARFFVRFFHNHGMMSVDDRPTWRVVKGGSRTYAEALVRPFRERIRLGRPALAVGRSAGSAWVRSAAGEEPFDAVVLACHADQALALISDPSPAEREILRCFPYQENTAILHEDASFLPRSRSAWSAWNYHIPRIPGERVAVSYDMNALQGFTDCPTRFVVTLNPHRPIAGTAIRSITYQHPLFTPESPAAQRRHGEINGVDRLHFAGAYWGWGFHEDGVRSAIAAVRSLTDARIVAPGVGA